MHADLENVRNPVDTAALPCLLSARHCSGRITAHSSTTRSTVSPSFLRNVPLMNPLTLCACHFRVPFLSFWPSCQEMRESAVNQTRPEFDIEIFGSASFELLTGKLIRNTVVVPVDLDV